MITQAINSMKDERNKLSKIYLQVIKTIPLLESSEGSLLDVNLDIEIEGAFGSINECNARIASVLSLTDGIINSEGSDFTIVPKSIVLALPTNISKVENQLNGMLLEIEQVKSDGGLRDVADDLIIHSVNQSAHPNIDLKSFYRTVDNQVDQVLKGIHEILSILKPSSYDPFSGALGRIKQLTGELQPVLKVIANVRKDAKTKASQISIQADQASASLTKLESSAEKTLATGKNFHDEVEKHASEASKEKSKITDTLAEVTVLEQQAKTLKEQVEEYQLDFKNFKSKLDDRETAFTTGNEEFEELRGKMIAASKMNDEYIANSKKALGWTTASGLASSFATSAEELKDPVMYSRLGFYVSIFILFVSAFVAFNGIPIVRSFVIVPSFPVIEGKIDASLLAVMLSVASIKIAVLVPAIILVGFSSRRHRALFHQYQLYIYKKTIASALPGFRDHADTHQEAMAAAAFARLLFNPQEDASRELTKEAGGQWWLSRWLERIVSKGVKDVLAADGKARPPSADM